MGRPRKPKPTDLLTARMIADEYGWDIRHAESVVRAIGRQGGLVRIEGLRRIYIRRGDLETRIQVPS